jgi:ribosomal protein L16 Arg81 hydroxylase
MLGVGVDRVVEILVGQGIDPNEARSEITRLQGDPTLEAGRWMADRLAKLESFLDVRQALGRLAPECVVDRRTGLTREDFLVQYYAANRPVLVDDVTTGWPALTRWDPEYLRSVIGDELVEVMDGRNADRRYEVNSDNHRTTMPFSTYVDLVLATAWGNNSYLVANNHLLEREAAKSLWDDFTIDDRYLDPSAASNAAFLWFGPAGTVTPLHHDIANIMFTQIVGRKRVTLISPLQSHLLYNEVGVFSEVDPRDPDNERFPRFCQAEVTELVVGPGDALFIPVGFWHHVEALDLSISLTFTNFYFPNTFTWRHPQIIRTG